MAKAKSDLTNKITNRFKYYLDDEMAGRNLSETNTVAATKEAYKKTLKYIKEELIQKEFVYEREAKQWQKDKEKRLVYA